MIRGIYTAASAMSAVDRKMTLISNNLANASTGGFRRQIMIQSTVNSSPVYRVQSASSRPLLVGSLSGAVIPEHSATDLEQGALVNTERMLDVALDGRGFFAVQTPQGERYSRDGRFSVKEGILVNAEGYPVLGTEGVILLGGGEVTINDEGEIHENGEYAGTLLVLDLPEGAVPVGKNAYSSDYPATRAEGYVVKQGALEGSNVSVVREMVEMISAVRAYEAAQKVITAQDEVLQKAANDVGRVG